jgi:hypothetical protein
MKINVENHRSNITIFIHDNDVDGFIDVNADECSDYPYYVNLEAIEDDVAMLLERHLNENESIELEEKISIWLNYHSCSDDEYYDKEEN